MYIIVQHQISDPSTFWGTAQEALGNLPAGVRIIESFPNADGSKATCLWEADSVETLRNYIDSQVGQVSRNEYYEVAAEKAFGLPG